MRFSRDLFLFSYYNRGMSLVDIARLKRCDIRDGYIDYTRAKTGTPMRVKIEERAQEVLDKWCTGEHGYLFPILRDSATACENNLLLANRCRMVNNHLKAIARMVGHRGPLTLYCARHSWASNAHAAMVAVPVISAALGHASEATTRVYLDSLAQSEVDRVNHMLVSHL